MWTIGLPVVIKMAIQVVSGQRWVDLFKFKIADNDDASSRSSD